MKLCSLEGPYDRLLTSHLVQGRIINATKEDVPGSKVFAMNGTAEYYEDQSQLAKFYDYDLILPATKGKINGISHASECPAALRPSDPQEL